MNDDELKSLFEGSDRARPSDDARRLRTGRPRSATRSPIRTDQSRSGAFART